MATLSPRLGSNGSVSSQSIMDSYLTLPQNGKIQAEYIWIGGSGLDIRSKTRTLKGPINNASDVPEWNYDGSSTGQAKGSYSEVWLKPVKIVPDPFRRLPNILVLCETLNAKTMEPLNTNRRSLAAKVFNNKKVIDEQPWYGIEQEYTLFEADDITPLGWPRHGFPAPQGPYYCGVGKGKANGRHMVEAHYRACLYANINISGINAEVMPGQWEFQVGPCLGIDAGDQVWLARYILERVGEDFGIVVSFEPKPVRGDWNGAGSHTNYSTKSMRTPKFGNKKKEDEKESKSSDDVTTKKCDNNNNNNNDNDKKKPLGMDAIMAAIGKLAANHAKHMKLYGSGNEQRLLGSHETARFDEFSYGVANRGASVRIPRQCDKDGYGYLEDRRPAANCDPYDVTCLIAETTIL